jgi:hypothetical protein
MKEVFSHQPISPIEEIKPTVENGGERDSSKVLVYSKYRPYYSLAKRTKDSCNIGVKQGDKAIEDVIKILPIEGEKQTKIESINDFRCIFCWMCHNANLVRGIVLLGQTCFAAKTRFEKIPKMDNYDDLLKVDIRRLSLRKEMAKKNIELPAAAKYVGVNEPINHKMYKNHGYMS